MKNLCALENKKLSKSIILFNILLKGRGKKNLMFTKTLKKYPIPPDLKILKFVADAIL